MICGIAVVIPAADEQDRLGSCLHALATARSRLAGRRRDLIIRVVVVLDACTDASASIVATARDVEAVRVEHRSVGRARAAGADQVLRGIAHPGSWWLASTDADSRVPVHWLTDMVELADGGADLVVGTVAPEAGLPPAALAAWSARHSLVDGHRHVHGANLGVRGSSYAALGGWSPLASGEDVDLVARAEQLRGIRIVRTARVPVRTSARLRGRVPHGFATYLDALATQADGLAS